MAVTIGVDVGGTFTDVVAFDGEELIGGKVPTTRPQERGVLDAVETVGGTRAGTFLHGTTAGTNALLEGRGARVALVTTAGFEDLIEIGRQARPSLYDPFFDRPTPLVDGAMRFGYDGDLASLMPALASARPEAVAVALVRSFEDPSEEEGVAARIADALGVPVSTGATVSPGFREYERIATTVLDAYIAPEISGYLDRLRVGIAIESKLIMTSAGGLLPFQTAARLAGRLALSGPAAGVVAASELARLKGYRTAFSFDMGGTSTDVCRISDGQAVAVPGRNIGGRVNRVPTLPINTIGAGGGSIAWRDDGGALRVGPQSAGADPGPAAYGRGGTRPTVTDANVVLGRLPVDLALAGSMSLDHGSAALALGKLGSVLGLDLEETASGILEVVDSHMERAIRSVSVEEGIDPREGALIAFGGAGGLHASNLARRLGIATVLIPPLSGVFSALGLLLARPRADATRTVLLAEGSPLLAGQVAEIQRQARDAYDRMLPGSDPTVQLFAEVRYLGQSHELAVRADRDWSRLRSRFEEAHRSRFGFDLPTDAVQLVNLRAEMIGDAPMSWGQLPRRSGTPVARTSSQGTVWDRDQLPGGFTATGPGLVVERDSVTVLESGDRLSVHDDGTFEISIT